MGVFIGRGGAGALAGTEGRDLLWASAAGGSALDAGGGADVLVGGTGAGDTLRGGAGDDVYVLGEAAATVVEGRGGGSNTVWGFGAGDVFVFGDAASPREVARTQEGSDFVLTIGGIAGQGADAARIVFAGVDGADMQAGFTEDGLLRIAFLDVNPVA